MCFFFFLLVIESCFATGDRISYTCILEMLTLLQMHNNIAFSLACFVWCSVYVEAPTSLSFHIVSTSLFSIVLTPSPSAWHLLLFMFRT